MNKTSIHPLPGFVIAIPFEEKEVSGIIVPDSMSNKDGAGEVVAVGEPYTIYEGPQQLIVKSPVKIGDKIIFSNFTRPSYLDLKTGKHVYVVKFSPDPRYTDIQAIITE